MSFSLVNAVCGYPRHPPVLKDISFKVDLGEVVCVLGANGAGKSTLFKSMLKIIPLQGGQSLVDEIDIAPWSAAKVAQKIGYVPQAADMAFAFTAFDVMLMGCTSAVGMFGSPSENDERLVDHLACRLGIRHLENQSFCELSGGEKQLVIIARALAQQPEILVMDEPTSALDFGNQQLVLEQIGKLSSQGLSIVMASHFPDHAFRYAHRVVLLKDGRLIADGTPDEVITESSLRSLYGVNTRIIQTEIPSHASEGRAIRAVIPLDRKENEDQRGCSLS